MELVTLDEELYLISRSADDFEGYIHANVFRRYSEAIYYLIEMAIEILEYGLSLIK